MRNKRPLILLSILALIDPKHPLPRGTGAGRDDFLAHTHAGGARGAQLVVKPVDLDAADVRVLAVLVVLDNLHLHDVGHEAVAVLAAAGGCQGHVDPARGVDELRGAKGQQVVEGGAGEPVDARWGVGLVLGVVDEEADGADFDTLDEGDGHAVGLNAIGSGGWVI